MKPFPLVTALCATIAFSATVESRLPKTKADTCTYYVPTRPRLTFTTIFPRTQRPRPDELPLSPPALPAPAKSSSNNVTKDNSSTSSTPQEMPSPPAWVLTAEDLITAVFRVVITVLTLFNVNITWRIRGTYHGMIAHKAMSIQSDASNSEPRSSPPWVGKCMGGCEI